MRFGEPFAAFGSSRGCDGDYVSICAVYRALAGPRPTALVVAGIAVSARLYERRVAGQASRIADVFA
jgi:hypothetical protein